MDFLSHLSFREVVFVETVRNWHWHSTRVFSSGWVCIQPILARKLLWLECWLFSQFLFLNWFLLPLFSQILSKLILPIFVKLNILFSDVADLFRFEQESISMNPPKFVWFNSGFLFSIKVYDPIDMEVEDSTHEYFYKLERYRVPSLFISSDLSPNICQKCLIFVRTIGFDETHWEEQPWHLWAVHHFLVNGVIFIYQQTNVHRFIGKVRIKLLKNEFVRSSTNLCCILICLCFLRHDSWDGLLLILPPHGILV